MDSKIPCTPNPVPIQAKTPDPEELQRLINDVTVKHLPSTSPFSIEHIVVADAGGCPRGVPGKKLKGGEGPIVIRYLFV